MCFPYICLWSENGNSYTSYDYIIEKSELCAFHISVYGAKTETATRAMITSLERANCVLSIYLFMERKRKQLHELSRLHHWKERTVCFPLLPVTRFLVLCGSVYIFTQSRSHTCDIVCILQYVFYITVIYCVYYCNMYFILLIYHYIIDSYAHSLPLHYQPCRETTTK